MSERSAALSLPYIQAGQAQKHVTHNEALAQLDAIVQLVVRDAALTTPPADPAPGDRYLVAPGGAAAWAGQDGAIALWDGFGWRFTAAQAGWQARDLATDTTVYFDGSAWQAETGGTGGTAPSQLPQLGINASADLTNRLTVSSEATLLNHAGSDHRLKLNRAGPAGTASLLFQSGFSGRAEMGIAGEDAFSIKVSPDGANFTQALRVDPETGLVSVKGFDSQQIQVSDNAAASVTTPSGGGIVFVSQVGATAPGPEAHGIFVYNTGAAAALATIWTGAALDNLGTQALSGTTGAAGQVSLAVTGTSQIVIENRRGAGTAQFSLSYVGGYRAL